MERLVDAALSGGRALEPRGALVEAEHPRAGERLPELGGPGARERRQQRRLGGRRSRLPASGRTQHRDGQLRPARRVAPNDVEDDAVVGGVAVVAVRPPVGGDAVQLDVAGAAGAVELDDGVLEVGPVPGSGPPRVEDAHAAPVDGAERAPLALLPQHGEESLGQRPLLPAALAGAAPVRCAGLGGGEERHGAPPSPP